MVPKYGCQQGSKATNQQYLEKALHKTRINVTFVILVISELILQQRRALECKDKQFIRTSNAPGTCRNHDTHVNWYLEFCDFGRVKPFLMNEFKITKFATFLADKMRTIDSIKMYCRTIVQQNELKGHRPVKLGLRFYKTITGIWKELHHQPK